MSTSDLSDAIDAALQEFMVYVSDNFKTHDSTPVTCADLREYSAHVVDMFNDMKHCIIDYFDQQ